MRYLVLNFAILCYEVVLFLNCSRREEELEITSRCYFNEVTRNHIALLFHRSCSKSHREAISPKLLENHIALLFQRSYSKITSSCYFTEVTRNHIALLFQWSYSKFYRDLMIPVNLKITYLDHVIYSPTGTPCWELHTPQHEIIFCSWIKTIH